MTMGNYGRLVVGGTSWVLESRGFQDIVDRGDCLVGEGYPTIFGAHWNLGLQQLNMPRQQHGTNQMDPW